MNVNAFPLVPLYLTPMCQHAHYVFSIQRYLGRSFQKLCQSNPNPLATQDLKKGDLLGKGADAVVSIFLLPGNHKVAGSGFPSPQGNCIQELKTKVVKGSANPVFNESFQFGVSTLSVQSPHSPSSAEAARRHSSNNSAASGRLGQILQERLHRRGGSTHSKANSLGVMPGANSSEHGRLWKDNKGVEGASAGDAQGKA